MPGRAIGSECDLLDAAFLRELEVLLAVNLASQTESDLHGMEPRGAGSIENDADLPVDAASGVGSAEGPPPRKSSKTFRKYAWLLALFALGLTVADVAYVTRKPRRRGDQAVNPSSFR